MVNFMWQADLHEVAKLVTDHLEVLPLVYANADPNPGLARHLIT